MPSKPRRREAAAAATVKSRMWPADQVERWPIERLIPYAKNPRLHDPAQVRLIADNMLRRGWTAAVLADEKGELVAGHGRIMAAKLLVSEGRKEFGTIPVNICVGWTDDEKREQRIFDNQSALLSTWDVGLLKDELVGLREADFDLAQLGFGEPEMIDLGVLGEETKLGQTDRHALLPLVEVTIDDPKHDVARGDHFILSKRHHLIVGSVIDGWKAWAPLLANDVLFCPYAGVFVPFSAKAKDHVLVMVQPDPYIAGHILDRYAEIHGEKRIVKQ